MKQDSGDEALQSALKGFKDARANVEREATEVLQSSGVSTDALLRQLLESAEAIFQRYDITGDEKGRLPGAELQKASLGVALVSRLGAREGRDDAGLVLATATRIAELARKSSLLHNAVENLRCHLSTATFEGGRWHLWPRDDRHFGVAIYEMAMTASTRSRFHELIDELPVSPELVRGAEFEVEDRFRYRQGRDVTGPVVAPALDAVVGHEANLCRRSIEEELVFTADSPALLTNGLRIDELTTVLWGLFAVLHRRRLVLKSWAMRHPQDAGHGLVVVREPSWFAREIGRATGLSADIVGRALDLISTPEAGDNPSDQFLQRSPLVRLNDGRLMTGCHLVQALRYPILASEHLSEEAQQAVGDRFPRVIAERLRERGARAAFNLHFDQDGLRGDIDLVCLWDGLLFVAECKTTARFYLPDRTANLREEIESESPNCAVEQVQRASRYIDIAPGRVAAELGVNEGSLKAAQRTPLILLSGMEFDGCAARNVPIRCAPRLLRRISSATELAAELQPRFAPPEPDTPVIVTVGEVSFVIHSVDQT